MPRYRSRIKQYKREEPMFTSYDIEEQVKTTFEREVHLRSGGAIVIEQVEALVAIDVNSGKATAEDGIEETAYQTRSRSSRRGRSSTPTSRSGRFDCY